MSGDTDFASFFIILITFYYQADTEYIDYNTLMTGARLERFKLTGVCSLPQTVLDTKETSMQLGGEFQTDYVTSVCFAPNRQEMR